MTDEEAILRLRCEGAGLTESISRIFSHLRGHDRQTIQQFVEKVAHHKEQAFEDFAELGQAKADAERQIAQAKEKEREYQELFDAKVRHWTPYP